MSIFKKWFATDSEESFTIDGCKSAQKAVSKYGYSIVCPEDYVAPTLSSDPNCANAQKVAYKYGYTFTCPE